MDFALPAPDAGGQFRRPPCVVRRRAAGWRMADMIGDGSAVKWRFRERGKNSASSEGLYTGDDSAMEPYKKRRWRRASSPDSVAFFTCARPGRSKSKDGKIPDKIVDLWVRNLPGPRTAIVSRLGAEPDGASEFSFYSFQGRESFQDWLDKRHGSQSIQVLEHPTTDYAPISTAQLAAIATDIARLLSEGCIVVLVDSGGETRTGQVCRYMGFVEDTRCV